VPIASHTISQTDIASFCAETDDPPGLQARLTGYLESGIVRLDSCWLANRVVADGDLDAVTAEFAARLAAQPPIAVREARRAIDAAWHSDPEESFRVAIEGQIRCLESEDFNEAGRAMDEGRNPKWRGC